MMFSIGDQVMSQEWYPTDDGGRYRSSGMVLSCNDTTFSVLVKWKVSPHGRSVTVEHESALFRDPRQVRGERARARLLREHTARKALRREKDA